MNLIVLLYCNIFYFTSYSYTDEYDLSKSYLLLEDRKSDVLIVANLLELNLCKYLPFLAYLSAYRTGRIKDEKFIDENIYLISIYQLVGYYYIIGIL